MFAAGMFLQFMLQFEMVGFPIYVALCRGGGFSFVPAVFGPCNRVIVWLSCGYRVSIVGVPLAAADDDG